MGSVYPSVTGWPYGFSGTSVPHGTARQAMAAAAGEGQTPLQGFALQTCEGAGTQPRSGALAV